MLDWLKNNLYNRWSFNLYIWHGLRTILRFGIIILLFQLGYGYKYSILGFFPFIFIVNYVYDLIVILPVLIVFLLEKKLGFRIKQKFFKNNVAFVIYILLSIPALIIETLIWLGAIFFIFYYIFESFFNSRIWIEYLDYTFSLDGLSMFVVWFS